MKARRIIHRIIGLPFVAVAGLVFAIVEALFRWGFNMFNYIRFGGETAVYNKYCSPTRMSDILNELIKQGDNKKSNPPPSKQPASAKKTSNLPLKLWMRRSGNWQRREST